MKAIHKKAIRDLTHMWPQAVTIALVLASGIACFVALRSAHESIVRSQTSHYARERLADVFVHLEQAPQKLVSHIQQIRGVSVVHPRIVRSVQIPLKAAERPALGQIISLPSGSPSPLCALHLQSGTMVDPRNPHDVVVLASFATAHGLGPGSNLSVIIEGSQHLLRVVGTVLSPEYVLALGPGSFIHDPGQFGVLWMNHEFVEKSFRLEGAFNDVVIALQPSASGTRVSEEIRRLLAPYGVLRAHTRSEQLSNRALQGEIEQLASFAVIAPTIFLSVAIFLIHVVIVRLLALQRSQIATLRSIGYTRYQIANHYITIVCCIVFAGGALGTIAGFFLGRAMRAMYRQFFQFPDNSFHLGLETTSFAMMISLATGVSGALLAVRRAVQIAPAEAMLPESPSQRLARPFKVKHERATSPVLHPSARGRMTLREIAAHPIRACLSVGAVALATGVVIAARFGNDAISTLFDVVFDRAHHDHIEVTWRRPMSGDEISELKHFPGVIQTEARRMLPARVCVGHRCRDLAVLAHNDGPSLRLIPQWPMRSFAAPDTGIAISRKLAEILHINAGDFVDLEILEGDRRIVRTCVTRVINDIFGLTAHASTRTLRRLVDEGPVTTSVLFVIDETQQPALYQHLAHVPEVLAVSNRRDVVRSFRTQTKTMWVTMVVLTAMGATLAFGAIYNHSRIVLSTRARDLASLRILGFTRNEISNLLFAELGFYLALGIPFGFAVGTMLVTIIASSADPESYRLPVTISNATFGFAALVSMLSAAASTLAIRRRINRLDLVAVLKARE